MIKQSSFSNRPIWIGLCIIFCVLFVQPVYSQTYEINVGDKRTLYAPNPPKGTIENGKWTCSNNDIWIYENGRGESADVKVSKFFSGTATINCHVTYIWYDGSASTGERYKRGELSQTYTIIAKPTKVKLNREELELDVYEDFQFTYTTEPLGLEPLIEWHSSNTDVARFYTGNDSPGYLETLSEGTCVITAIGNTGEKDPTCIVTVVDNKWVQAYVNGKIKTGAVKKGTEVVLASTKTGATIYYTVDGSEPTKNSTEYTKPIVINEDLSIKAKAYIGNQESKTSTFKYIVVSHLEGEHFTAKTKESVDVSYVAKNGFLEVSSGSIYTPAIDENYSGGITIPHKVDGMVVKTIAERAFYGCNISFLAFEEKISSKQLGKESFRNCKNLRYIELPHGISVYDMAFRDCESLEEILFQGWTSFSIRGAISNEVFYNCNNIKGIYINFDSPYNIKDNFFSEQTYNDAILYVPKGKINTYRSASSWKKFKNIVEIGSEQNEKLTLSASPYGGQVQKGTVVTLIAKSNGNVVSDCDIFYTLDGNVPSSNSIKYTSSGININSDCTVKAIAYKEGYETSDVLMASYTVKDNIASGDGSLSNPYNAVAAINVAGELGVGETSAQNYYVKGIISSLKYSYNAQYGTATFYISDDGTINNQFYIYGSYYLENKPWVDGNPQIEIGDEVIVYGKMTNYNGILEMADKKNYIYSHNGKTSINTMPSKKLALSASQSGGQVPAGTTITLTSKANGSIVYGCDIYYTLDGSTPSTNSTPYPSYGITINSDCTLKAIAYKDEYETSDILSEDYTIEKVDEDVIVATCAGVKAGKDGQIYRVTGKVKSIEVLGTGLWYLEDSTGDIYIHGTKIGNSPFYALTKLGIEIGDLVTVEGTKATDNGQVELVDVKVINVQKSKPALSLWAMPSSRQVFSGITITLTATDDNGSSVHGCEIYYTFDGTTPSKNNGSIYSNGITLTESCTLKAIAYKDGYEESNVLTENYIVKPTSEEGYYYVGNLNNWNADKSYPFIKLGDGKTWQLTLTDQPGYFKIFPSSAYDDLDCFYHYAYCSPYDGCSELSGMMKRGNLFDETGGAWIIEGSDIISCVIKIVPSTMQYEIIVNRQGLSEVVTATCAEVNAGTDGTIYRVTGTVKSITNTLYGNWNLEDSTGEVFIYGTRDKSGNKGKNNSIDNWGIETGDIVTVEGPRKTHNGIIELVDVNILSLQKGAKEVLVVPAKGKNSAGYATFYSSKSAYILPNGLSANVVTSATNNKLIYKTIADGSVSGVIPKGTAVMLVSETKQTGTFTLTSSNSTNSYNGTNLLQGNDEATTTFGDGYHYKLSYGPSGTQWKDVFGWYWGSQYGAPFQIDGHKAWLVVPESYGTRSFGFTVDGEITDIETTDISQQELDDFYDLQGRRIINPTGKGIYIRNGKKVVK